jgi:hypothetical protein
MEALAMKIPTSRDIEVPTQRTVKWRGKLPHPSSPFEPRTTPSRRGVAEQLPPLSWDGLVVASTLPLPAPRRMSRGKGKYDTIFDALTRDGMSVTNIPAAYASAMKSAARKYVTRRPELAKHSTLRVMRVDESTCGVWRVAADGSQR